MGVRQNMDNLRNKLRVIEDKIKEIQSSCSHEQTIIGFHHKSTSNAMVVIKCKDCDRFLRYPTEDEKTQFLKS